MESTPVKPDKGRSSSPTSVAKNLQNRIGEIQLEHSWKTQLLGEFEKPYMIELREFLIAEKKAGRTVYPPGPEMFSALNLTPFDKVRVVILGQDPYHGPGQAHELCFSVKDNVALPPSLLNIYKELQTDVGVPLTRQGNLRKWAEQGVLLLNASLSVEQGKPMSHQNAGWEPFTDRIIHILNEKREGLVFILWGSFAQKKAQFVDRKKHLVLAAPHPSPLSAHRGFLGSKPFSKTNEYLISRGESPINWNPHPQ